MFKNKFYILLLLLSSVVALFAQEREPAELVYPFIGTANHANRHPGASVPWGMLSLAPQNVDCNGDDNYDSGYIFGWRMFFGFSHANISGVEHADMGSIILLPFYGETKFSYLTRGTYYKNEDARAGYYSVDVGPSSALVPSEVTATKRTGVSRFTFPKGETGKLFLNMGRSQRDNRGAVVRIVNDSIVEGFKIDVSKRVEHRVYFTMQFSRKANLSQLFNNSKLLPDAQQRVADKDVGAYFEFDDINEPLLVKTAISYVSVENARENLAVENPGWDFDAISAQAYDEWNSELSKIVISDEDSVKSTMFYTALYHALTYPNIISDVNGEYPLMGEQQGVGCNVDRPRFSTFILSESYRTLHPLLTLVYPEVASQMLSSLVDMYRESGWLPRYEVASNETFLMGGDPASIVLSDSYIKGIRDFDYSTAYEAMLKHSSSSENLLRSEFACDSLTHTLECAHADWALAQFANEVGDVDNYYLYLDKAMQQLDVVTSDSWNVPYNVEGLIELRGGEDSFMAQLQEYFDDGHFSLKSRSNFSYPYIFTHLKGGSQRAQQEVARYIREAFTATPGGIPCCDGVGAVSAWLVFSMMGIYPECASSNQYSLITPSFSRIEISTSEKYYSGEPIVITKTGDCNGDITKKIVVNNRKAKELFIDHKELISGAAIEFKIK